VLRQPSDSISQFHSVLSNSCNLFTHESLSVAKSAILVMSIIFFKFFFFCPRYLQDRQADLHRIFHDDTKWAAIEKLSFWFPNPFGGGREVQKVPLSLWTQLHKIQHGGKNGFTYRKKKLKKLSDFG